MQTSLIEWIIFFTALIYILLAVYEHSLCWPFGILSCLLSIYLCFSGQLFLESFLQVFYVVIGLYGWYQWHKKSNINSAEESIINSISVKNIIIILIIGIALFLPIGKIASHYSTQQMPYLDAFITSFSIIATWMTAKKIIQNWIFWIVIDTLATILYAYRHFYLIAVIYIIYTFVALVGYWKWKQKMKLSNV